MKPGEEHAASSPINIFNEIQFYNVRQIARQSTQQLAHYAARPIREPALDYSPVHKIMT